MNGSKYKIVNSSKYKNTVKGSSNVGISQGSHSKTTVNNTLGAMAPLRQGQHNAAIDEAQIALIRDRDALEQIDNRLYEALNQFLNVARKIQVEQQSLADVQAKMKDTLDEVWAEHVAKGLRPRVLPKTLEVAEAMIKNPTMAEVVKRLLGA